MNEAGRVRAHVTFAGRVQGVGFRFTTLHIASSFDVTGTVMNLPNGSVELVAEGPRAEVESLVESISERMRRYIRTCEVEWGPATGEFTDFRVSYAW